jgi:Ca2+ transporting ATPase
MYFPGQTKASKENSVYYGLQGDPNAEPDNHKEHPDPFLFTDSKVMTGQGKALVCCVGANTLLARNRRPKDLVIDEQHTFLEDKLERTAKRISNYSLVACVLSVVTHCVFLLFLILLGGETLFSNATLLKLGKVAIIAVVILIVSIPEGLPLAVSIAMALSINRLKDDEILIKNLESVQTCAMFHDVCVGKTGTLTKARLRVASYQVCDQYDKVANDPDMHPAYFNTQLELQQELKEIIKECIISNTDVRIETNEDECKYVPKGQALEVGLIQFLMDNEEDIQNIFINRNRFAPKVVQLPFDQALKRKVVVRSVQGSPELVRIYVKGAPEVVLPACSQTLNHQVKPKPFTQEHQQTILRRVVGSEMAERGEKVLSFAFKEIRLADLNELSKVTQVESEKFRRQLEVDLIYLCTFGMSDPPRPGIAKSIQAIRYGHTGEVSEADDKARGDDGAGRVNVRMVTGDHLETAKAAAVACGICRADELASTGVAITGEEFRREVGGYSKIWDPVHQEFRVEFMDQRSFDEVKKRLKVIARATAEDRFILVSGIKQK